MAGDPTNVCGSPKYVCFGFDIEYRPVCIRRTDEVLAGGMHYSFWLTGGAGGVHDIQRMFGIECLRSVLIALPLDNIVPPHVPIVVPLNVSAGALDNQYIADLRQVCNGLIDCDLEAIGLTSAVPTIGGDNNFDTAVLNTVSDGLIRET